MRNLFTNLGLLVVACAVGLSLCEVSLRLFYPKYRHLAEARFRSDTMRIWARLPDSRDWHSHPDTGASHTFHHNNLALRQHRNFSQADLAAATNIGVFGDSFTENAGMPVHYSFTEPLDYLLNQSGERFNVLNFGVGGYGPGQSFLHYEHFRHAEDLDHVFYVYCENDIPNIYETGLFHLDEAGRLARNEAIRESWYTPLIRRLHASYLVLDGSGRLSSFLVESMAPLEELKSRWSALDKDEGRLAMRRAAVQQGGGLIPDVHKNGLAIFRQLLRHWKHLVEQNGSTFSVVLLPTSPPHPFIVDLLTAEDVEVIDLYTCFGNSDSAHTRRAWAQSPYRFKKNGHWNEAGNQLAAVCLYRVLEETVGLPSLSEGRLGEALSRYYSAFEGGLPLRTGGESDKGSGSLEAAAMIREKYSALDLHTSLTDLKEEILEVVAQPDKRIIAADFDVYLDGNRLLYVKEDCRPADTWARFFLHVTPIDESDLSERRRQHGFENMDFTQRGLELGDQRGLEIGDRRCVVQARLPAYPIRRIRTGQFVWDDRGNYFHLWEGAFSMHRDTDGEGGRG